MFKVDRPSSVFVIIRSKNFQRSLGNLIGHYSVPTPAFLEIFFLLKITENHRCENQIISLFISEKRLLSAKVGTQCGTMAINCGNCCGKTGSL